MTPLKRTINRLFPPDIVLFVEMAHRPAQPDRPLRPVVEAVLVPKHGGVKSTATRATSTRTSG